MIHVVVLIIRIKVIPLFLDFLFLVQNRKLFRNFFYPDDHPMESSLEMVVLFSIKRFAMVVECTLILS